MLVSVIGIWPAYCSRHNTSGWSSLTHAVVDRRHTILGSELDVDHHNGHVILKGISIVLKSTITLPNPETR